MIIFLVITSIILTSHLAGQVGIQGPQMSANCSQVGSHSPDCMAASHLAGQVGLQGPQMSSYSSQVGSHWPVLTASAHW